MYQKLFLHGTASHGCFEKKYIKETRAKRNMKFKMNVKLIDIFPTVLFSLHVPPCSADSWSAVSLGKCMAFVCVDLSFATSQS